MGRAQAGRVVYLSPLTSSVIVGGFDTTLPTPEYCESGFSFREILAGKMTSVNTRTGGAAPGLFATIRNISQYPQTVKIIFEELDFDACYWANGGVIFPPCFKKYVSNGVTGYPINFVLPAFKSANASIQIGCQGTTAENYCWLAHWAVMSENVQLAPANMNLYGVPALFNPASMSLVQHLCYSLKSFITMRIEVAEDRGALTGVIGTADSAAAYGGRRVLLNGESKVYINGGKPF